MLFLNDYLGVAMIGNQDFESDAGTLPCQNPKEKAHNQKDPRKVKLVMSRGSGY